MTPAHAAEVLRGLRNKPKHLQGLSPNEINAVDAGLDALDFAEWLFQTAKNGRWNYNRLLSSWKFKDSFLDYARAEWEKEREG
jgi:hypothetical protein